MAVPQMTADQRRAALEKAAATRKARAEARDQLREGEIGVADFLAKRDDPVIGKIRVTQFIQTLPGYGKAKAGLVMSQVGIAENRRLSGLGDAQVAKLIEMLG